MCECVMCGREGREVAYVGARIGSGELEQTMPVCVACVLEVRTSVVEHGLEPCPWCGGEKPTDLVFTVDVCDCLGHWRPAVAFCSRCEKPWGAVYDEVPCLNPN